MTVVRCLVLPCVRRLVKVRVDGLPLPLLFVPPLPPWPRPLPSPLTPWVTPLLSLPPVSVLTDLWKLANLRWVRCAPLPLVRVLPTECTAPLTCVPVLRTSRLILLPVPCRTLPWDPRKLLTLARQCLTALLTRPLCRCTARCPFL